MLVLFRYNWQVREEWFRWCSQVASDELLRQRVGGVGSILQTLYHVVDVEVSWIRGLMAKPPLGYDFSSFANLDKVSRYSSDFHPEVEEFLKGLSPEMELQVFIANRNGQQLKFTYGEILHQILVHEIHHIGQLSVWSRELGLEPVSSTLFGRGLFESPNL